MKSPGENNREKERLEEFRKQVAYRAISSGLREIQDVESLRNKQARKRTGINVPAHLYDPYPNQQKRLSTAIDPLFNLAMQRIWDIGTIDREGKADQELRRAYLLIARGHAPLTRDDVIELGQMPDDRLRPLLRWLAHRLSLAEARVRVEAGEAAPPVTES